MKKYDLYLFIKALFIYILVVILLWQITPLASLAWISFSIFDSILRFKIMKFKRTDFEKIGNRMLSGISQPKLNPDQKKTMSIFTKHLTSGRPIIYWSLDENLERDIKLMQALNNLFNVIVKDVYKKRMRGLQDKVWYELNLAKLTVTLRLNKKDIDEGKSETKLNGDIVVSKADNQTG